MVRGDVLQIVIFGVPFLRLAVSAIGEKGNELSGRWKSPAKIMFQIYESRDAVALIGVGAAMAHTIGTQRQGVRANPGQSDSAPFIRLLSIFIFASSSGWWSFGSRRSSRCGNSSRPYTRSATLAFATTSSESALPKAMESMERVAGAATYRLALSCPRTPVQSGRFDA